MGAARDDDSTQASRRQGLKGFVVMGCSGASCSTCGPACWVGIHITTLHVKPNPRPVLPSTPSFAMTMQQQLRKHATLKEAAMSLGLLNSEEFDQLVRPETMIAPKPADGKLKSERGGLKEVAVVGCSGVTH